MSAHVTHMGVHDHGFNNISTYGNLLRLMRAVEAAGHCVHWSTMLFHTNDFYGTTAPTALANAGTGRTY